MKTSKVISANFKRTFESQHGTIHVFEITFEDGTVGEYNTTKNPQNTFTPGVEVQYVSEQKTGTKKNGEPFTYNRITKYKEPFVSGQSQMSPEQEARIKRSVFLKASTHMIAMWHFDKAELFKQLESLYSALAVDKDSRISFLGVINTISEEALYHVDSAPSLDDVVKRIITYFNYVMGIKK